MALPKFLVTIDEAYAEDGESLGIEMIANTATPAIKVKGFAFMNQQPKLLAFADNLKYRIAGPIMIPGDIYRCDEDGFEYEVSFTSEEIEKIHSKFMLSNKSNQSVFNVEHNADVVLPSFILEAFLVDSESKIKMIKEEYNIDVPMGTSFVVQQFTNKEVYQQMVDEQKIGFSIEGFLGLALSEQINNNKQKQKEKMEEKLTLPAGEYVMGDKVYVVAEDGTFVIKEKEAMAEEVVVEEEVALAEEPIKEEVKLAEAEVVEEEMAEPVVAESYSKEEVDAKFQEIYQMIADMKAEEVSEDEVEGEVPVAMSVNSKFSSLERMRLFANK